MTRSPGVSAVVSELVTAELQINAVLVVYPVRPETTPSMVLAKLKVIAPALGLVLSMVAGTLMTVAPTVTLHAPALFVNVSVKTAGDVPLVVAVVRQFALALSTVTKLLVTDGRKTAAEGVIVMVVVVDKEDDTATSSAVMVVTEIVKGELGVSPTV